MTSIVKSGEPGSPGILGQEDQPSASEVKETLRLILESHPFRTSKQCQDLLRYVVDHSLNGAGNDLRERIIGAEVFHRNPSYDTNEDPVVRVRAADVRKRLAQYYQSLGPGSDALHIELPPGSYRARFSHTRPHAASTVVVAPVVPLEPVLPPAPAVRRRSLFSGRWLSWSWSKAVAIALIVMGIAGGSFWIEFSWSSPQQRFWAPVTGAQQPALIYLGTNVGYIFSSDFLAKYRAAHGMPNNGPEFLVDLPAGSTVRAEDLVAMKDTFVTTADVSAIVQVTTLFRDWKRPFVLRTGRDLSFGDLRNRPSVMIGAFNNPWTLELTSDLPFSFRQGNQIFNRDHPERSWRVPGNAGSAMTFDYALITRLLTSKTGGPSITAAGIGEFGTLAVAEFLADPDKMRELLKTAPKGWERKNMQAVLSVKVVDYQPVSADVVAVSYW